MKITSDEGHRNAHAGVQQLHADEPQSTTEAESPPMSAGRQTIRAVGAEQLGPVSVVETKSLRHDEDTPVTRTEPPIPPQEDETTLASREAVSRRALMGPIPGYLAALKEVFPDITMPEATALVDLRNRTSNARLAALMFFSVGTGLIGWSAYALIEKTIAFMTLCGIGSGCFVIAALFLGLSTKEVELANLTRNRLKDDR